MTYIKDRLKNGTLYPDDELVERAIVKIRTAQVALQGAGHPEVERLLWEATELLDQHKVARAAPRFGP